MFSTPKVKARVASEKYNCNDNFVRCAIKVSLNESDPYIKLLMMLAYGGVIQDPYYNSKNYNKSNLDRETNNSNIGCMLDKYEFTGIARLKGGDKSDIKLAKKIAYKKAYRQFVGYYISNFNKLYDRMGEWLCSVCYNPYNGNGVIDQLCKLYDRVDNDIVELMEN